MKKKILWGAGVILLVSILYFLSPFNFFYYLNAEKKVTSILAEPAIQQEGFGGELEVTNIKYLGNYLYRIETEDNVYLMKIKEKRLNRKIEIFEFKQHITHFYSYE